jgi:hypothetical protein
MIRNLALDPFFPLICDHDDFLLAIRVFILAPRRITIGETIPQLRMACRYVLEPLRWVSELQRLEDKVNVDPVMCGLVVDGVWERIPDVEDVAIYLLVGVRRKILQQLVGGCCEI